MLRSKVTCEICGDGTKNILHRHHIIPQADPRCKNSNFNVAVLCPNCHSCVHCGRFIIIGVYQSTEGPIVMWFKKGEDPPLPEEHWYVKDNPLVITLNKDDFSEKE